MAEHRPYRVTNRSFQAQLAQIKLISVASFLTVALAINWVVTERAAAIFGYSPLLGPTLIGRLYAPWEWIVWWARWHTTQEFSPLWQVCVREAGLPLLIAAGLAVAAIPPRTLDAQRRNPRPPRLGEMGEHARHPDRRGRISGKDPRCGVEIRAPTPDVPRIRLLEKAEP